MPIFYPLEVHLLLPAAKQPFDHLILKYNNSFFVIFMRRSKWVNSIVDNFPLQLIFFPLDHSFRKMSKVDNRHYTLHETLYSG